MEEKTSDFPTTQQQQSHDVVIDESVRHLNTLINGNISLQEIIISILGRKVQNQFELLKQIHTLDRRLNGTTAKFTAKVETMKKMREIQVGDNIFKRLYCRLQEKLSRKFALFESYKRKLSFIGSSIKLLYSYYQESSLPETHKNLLVFVEILNIIIEQNSQLYQLLLDLLVSQNFVSSIDEFNLLGIEPKAKPMAVTQNNEESSSEEEEIQIFGKRNRRQESRAQINDMETRITIEELFKRLKDHNEKTFRSSARLNNIHKSAHNKNRGTSKIYNSLEKLFLKAIESTNSIKEKTKEETPKLSNPASSRKISKFHEVLIQLENFNPTYDQTKKSKIKKVNQNFKSLNVTNRGLYTANPTKREKIKTVIKSAFGKCLRVQSKPAEKPVKRMLVTQQTERDQQKKFEYTKNRLYKKYKTMIDEFVEQIDQASVERTKKENYILQAVPQKEFKLPDEIQGLLTVRKFKPPQEQGENQDSCRPEFSTTLGRYLEKQHRYSKSSHSLKRKPCTQRQIDQNQLLTLNQNRLRRIRALKAKLTKSSTPKFQIFCPRQLKISVRGSH